MTVAIPSVSKDPDSTPGRLVPRHEAPSSWVMHLTFFFVGLGMLVLGPILPVLAAEGGLQDGRSGMLLGAQFLGSFSGSISLGQDLRANLMQGCLAAIGGFGAFAAGAALHAGFGLALLAAFLCGLGLGRITTSINLIAGARYGQRRGSALSLLNVSWGIGAFAAPLLVAGLMPQFGLVRLLALFATMGASIAVALYMQFRQATRVGAAAPDSQPQALLNGIPLKLVLYFACLFLLYGGLESSVSGWLSTFSIRYAGGTVRTAAFATTALWIGLSVGRVAASVIFLRVPERIVLLVGVALSGLCTAALGQTRSISQVASLALILGLCMAPIFPAACSRLIATGPRPQQAGVAMAISALGGACEPWLVGILSQRRGSLRQALMLPALTAALLLALTLARPDRSTKSV